MGDVVLYVVIGIEGCELLSSVSSSTTMLGPLAKSVILVPPSFKPGSELVSRQEGFSGLNARQGVGFKFGFRARFDFRASDSGQLMDSDPATLIDSDPAQLMDSDR